MLDPSSGRDNFNVVLTQTADSTNTGQTSQVTTENNNAAQALDKKEVEEKTTNAINAATSSQSQTHQ